jgi:hypothetical protein
LRAVALQRAGVKTGIQNLQPWIPAGVYPDGNRGRNDKLKIMWNDLTESIFQTAKLILKIA